MSNIVNKKAAIIGAGYVGASITYALAMKAIAHEIVLIERCETAEKCIAEINDIRHGIPYMGTSNIHIGNYADIKDCDIIIIAAGRNRRPDETRLEMTADNIRITTGIAEEVKKHYTRGVVLVVTNPVDIITRAFTHWLELPNGIVFGTGCLLDSSRLINIIADHVGLSCDVINAHVIGEHGEGQIVVWSKATIAGIPIEEYCQMNEIEFTEETITIMENKLRNMGTDIIKGKGRTHYGIATCVCYIADTIVNNRSTVLNVSSVLNGEYGIYEVALSLPCIVDVNGVKHRLIDKLNNTEMHKVREAAEKLDLEYKRHL